MCYLTPTLYSSPSLCTICSFPQDCFKLLGGMLRQCERWAPSQGQLRFLVTWAFADLEETAGRQNAFHLLKVTLALPGEGGWIARCTAACGQEVRHAAGGTAR